MICCSLALLWSALAGTPPAPAAPAATRVVLRDQHGRDVTLAAGRPQVVFVVAAQRLRRLKDWEVALDRRVEGVGYLRVADVVPREGEPAGRYDQMAGTLRKRVPETIAIAIDAERVWAKELKLDSREVNVLVFDAAHRLLAREGGEPTAPSVRRVAALLLGLPGVQPRSDSPDARPPR